MFSGLIAQFQWCFVFEAPGPEWQTLDLGKFLEIHANYSVRRSHLFSETIWSLWTIRKKMVIEHVFLRRGSDSMFKFLEFFYSCGTRSVGSGTGAG
jgi:hypothetical protein